MASFDIVQPGIVVKKCVCVGGRERDRYGEEQRKRDIQGRESSWENGERE